MSLVVDYHHRRRRRLSTATLTCGAYGVSYTSYVPVVPAPSVPYAVPPFQQRLVEVGSGETLELLSERT